VSGSIAVELTLDEAHGLVTLLDAACKAGGLHAAIVAAPIFAKLQAAVNEPARSEDAVED